MTYKPDHVDENTPVVVLVGKGLTFDAGGYNIKPTGSMEDMKLDMAGGAAVLGAMKAVSELKPEGVIVHGLVATAENMVSGGAVKPSSVIQAYDGTWVEIMNTDAEGRLVLADALGYAVKHLSPDLIVNAATLTGACMIALGPYRAALYASNDDAANIVLGAGATAREKFWRMPLDEDDLGHLLKSAIATTTNVGAVKMGGATTAGIFLSLFVQSIPWVHIDLAGPAYLTKAHGAKKDEYGTGFAVRTFVAIVMNHLAEVVALKQKAAAAAAA